MAVSIFSTIQNVGNSLYSSTPDSDLFYNGDDPIVWDRINDERLRRGLSPLPNPRPEDPDAPTYAPPPRSQSAERQQLDALETRREQLVAQTSALQNIIYVNQATLQRKQIELSQTTDPQERARLQQQITQLQTLVATEQKRLIPLQTQLVQTDQQAQAALSAAFPGRAGLPTALVPEVPGAEQFSNLRNLAVSSPVSAADVLKQISAVKNIPGLNTAQITGLLGSAAALSGQATGAVSASKGIGKFGLTPQQLEEQGYIKPGMIDSFVANQPAAAVTAADIAEADRINQESGDPTGITPEQVAANRQLNQTLSSPFMWTGKNGVKDLSVLTSNENLQSVTQQDVLSSSLDQLKKAGAVTGAEAPQALGSLLQASSKFGVASVADWTKGKAPADVVSAINDTAKNAEYAVNLVDTKLPEFGTVPFKVEGEVATVDRSRVDAALASLLGNPKIPLPSFGGGSAGGLEQDLYRGTKDEDLTYTGDDPIVWDRVNAERLRRGLAGLESLGYPRPPEDVVDRGPGDFG